MFSINLSLYLSLLCLCPLSHSPSLTHPPIQTNQPLLFFLVVCFSFVFILFIIIIIIIIINFFLFFSFVYDYLFKKTKIEQRCLFKYLCFALNRLWVNEFKQVVVVVFLL